MDIFTRPKTAVETLKSIRKFLEVVFEDDKIGAVKLSIVSNNSAKVLDEKQGPTILTKESYKGPMEKALKFFSISQVLDFINIGLTFSNLGDSSIVFYREEGVATKVTLNHSEKFSELIFNAFDRHFPAQTRSSILLDYLPEEQKNLLNSQQHAVSSLSAEVSTLGRFVAEQIEKNQEFIRKVQQDGIDAERKRKNEHDEAVAKEQVELRQAWTKLEQAKAEFDARESKLVRRDLIEKMQKKIQEFNQFDVKKATTSKRLPIHFSSAFLAAVGATLAGVAAYNIFSTKDIVYPYYALFATGTILFGSTAVFYLRWTNAWFTRHADIELNNVQFENHMLRASWIAELLFEASDNEKQVDIPDQLLEHFARNLFEYPTQKSNHHPVDDLQKYAKRFRKFSVGQNGIHVEAGEK